MRGSLFKDGWYLNGVKRVGLMEVFLRSFYSSTSWIVITASSLMTDWFVFLCGSVMSLGYGICNVPRECRLLPVIEETIFLRLSS